ncbi:MAG TPA: Stp1/IreP family PP2C-type Ser/Thr phosphatase [Actinobacteria bacterium]|nr:Stp1/IreP family PP2C-type Ser/Thr phosphatase [Actinomycetota bacterium]
MKFASATHVGRVRQENEDYVIAKNGVFIVADGMGGHSAGDVASKLASETAYKVISASTEEDKLKVLQEAVKAANKKVIDKAQQIQVQKGMGTTITIAVIDGMKAYLAHIGDSRAYILRGSQLKQLSEDHSLVAEMVKEGKITNKEADEHPYRNVITRAVGSDLDVKTDVFSFELKKDDRLVLTSDGLTGMLKDAEIKKLVTDSKLKDATNKLIEAANEKGGQDNISVVLVDIKDGYIQPKAKNQAVSVNKLRMIVPIVLIIVITSVLAGGYYLNINNYYLAPYGNKVALYRGLSYSVFGFKFSKVSHVSDINYEDLDSVIKKRLSKKITVKDEKEGLKAIEDIGDELKQ